MNTNQTNVHPFRRGAAISGGLATLLGGMVLLGWHTHSVPLIQIHASFAPMQYNAALGFLLCGLSLLLRLWNRKGWALVCGLLGASIGLLTLVQYIFGIDLGIDQLLLEHYVTVETSHPGRMAPNTALCFLLTGSALASTSCQDKDTPIQLVAATLGALVLALGAVALLGYAWGIAPAYGWGALTRMALHTSAGFVLLGMGLLSPEVGVIKTRGVLRPILSASVVMAVAVLLGQALQVQQDELMKRVTSIESMAVTDRIRTEVLLRIRMLQRMADRWAAHNGTPKDKWEQDAKNYVVDDGYYSILRTDSDFKTCSFVFQDGKERSDIQAGSFFNLVPRTALVTARDAKTAVLSEPFELDQGIKGFAICLPLYVNGRFDGLMAGSFEFGFFLKAILTDMTEGHQVTVQAGGHPVFHLLGMGPSSNLDLGKFSQVRLPGVVWNVACVPTQEAISQAKSVLPVAVQGVGLLTAILLGFIHRLTNLALLRAQGLKSANLEVELEAKQRILAETELKESHRLLECRLEELRASEKKFRGVTEASPNSILLADREGIIRFANSRTLDLFGYQQDELHGQPVELLVPHRYREKHVAARNVYALAPVKRGMGETQLELSGQRKDGMEIPLEIGLTPLGPEQGHAVLVTMTDISERRKAEKAIKEKSQSLETLLYITSHDLREPLRAIRNFSKIVWEENKNKLDAESAKDLERIVRAGDRMDCLIQEVLNLSRAQRKPFRMQTVSGSDLVHSALVMLEEAIREKDARVSIAPHWPQMRVDMTWATQAVQNLIANALKFSGNDAPPEIEIAPHRAKNEQGEQVGVAVRDRGPGVPERHHERIFELFQRAVGREITGTGAGLAIVRQVAERHGGQAWVRNRDGGGAEFVITFGPPAEMEKNT